MRSYSMPRRSSSANSGPNHSGCSYSTPRCGDSDDMHRTPISGTLIVAAGKASAARTGTADLNCRAERVQSRPDGTAKARGPSPRDRCSLGDEAGILCAGLDVRTIVALAPYHTSRARPPPQKVFSIEYALFG